MYSDKELIVDFFKFFNIKISRLKFASKLKRWIDEWQYMIYLDEKIFQSFSNGKILVKRKRGDGELEKYLHFNHLDDTYKINLLAAISYNNKVKLYLIQGTLDSVQYVNIIKEKLTSDFPRFNLNYILYQDNAPMHVSACTQSYFYKEKIHALKAPPFSPDLNPVEHIWGIAQRKLNEYILNNKITSEDELFSVVQNLVDQIDKQVINKLIKSMSNRIQSVIINKGKSTTY